MFVDFFFRCIGRQTRHLYIKKSNVILWTSDSIVHYNFLESRKASSSDVYSSHSETVSAAELQKKPALVERRKILIFHENAYLDTANMNKDVNKRHGLKVLVHPTSFLDVALSD